MRNSRFSGSQIIGILKAVPDACLPSTGPGHRAPAGVAPGAAGGAVAALDGRVRSVSDIPPANPSQLPIRHLNLGKSPHLPVGERHVSVS